MGHMFLISKGNVNHKDIYIYIYIYIGRILAARGVMVIDVSNGNGHTSSNPGRDWLHFTLH